MRRTVYSSIYHHLRSDQELSVTLFYLRYFLCKCSMLFEGHMFLFVIIQLIYCNMSE